MIVTAPAAFRFTYDGGARAPRPRRRAARRGGDGPDALPGVLLALMRDVGAPRGIAALGYGEDDMPALVEGARKQQRLLVVAPREPRDDDLAAILRASLENW